MVGFINLFKKMMIFLGHALLVKLGIILKYFPLYYYPNLNC